MDIHPELMEELIAGVQNSRKYRQLDLPRETLEDLLRYAAPLSRNKSELKRRLREKLHGILAPYLEDLDYAHELDALNTFAASSPQLPALKLWTAGLLSRHASTRERLTDLEALYQTIFRYIGIPRSIMDLACALNPLALPWMNLAPHTAYFAYDLHGPRVGFLNAFFKAFYPQASAVKQDILVQAPNETAEIGFFFKEAHRFEKRQPGSNRAFFASLPVRTLVVSLPARDLAGHHSLQPYHDQLIDSAIAGQGWGLERDQVGSELLYFIHKA